MSIRKIMLLVLVSVAIISISINALVLSALTDRYFKTYLSESYDQHIEQIKEYTKNAMYASSKSYQQMSLELETHLVDPIVRIKLYDLNGALLLDVKESAGNMSTNGTRYRGMMGSMMDNDTEEVDQYKIIDGDTLLGYLNITRNSSAENSIVAKLFKGSLIMNSIFSVGIALVFAVLLGIVLSRKMSLALKDTAEFANDLQVGETRTYKRSGIVEIKQIRDSLFELGMRLRLKQKSRKTLLDQMIHQSRTPLTIMKTHLEGIEDGVVEVNTDTLSILQNQIDTLTSIISNMSGMIDAEHETDELDIVSFDLNVMIDQIVRGLSASFQKKNIEINIKGRISTMTETDQFKLSQTIYNILTNAYKYSYENGRVLIEISFDQVLDRVTIEVKDDGMGIDERIRERIFDAYFRGNHDGTNSAGDGLGLYVARENMRRIGGEISCGSKPNKGSTFIITFPNKISV
ncbi:HAMP domain-containing sensor histidine kinase [Fusibacter bizertensis]|uniref:histidine kinase n=1 Tax=Fusibacter bizertensis TaxID=1488331 RepID=A0ABT6NAT1_9FIRM|nr:HAMP domain-containing sensor histidine kinase [Fusibacter bizertensis]MDH8677501.1 HAMP domain-containing sensor histidine kinase [Fusibacter bizertensis]